MLLYNTIVTEDKNFEKARMKRKQRRKLIWMVAGLVVLLYLGLAVYFHNHFFPKTTLNGRKAGGYTAQKVMDEITEEIHSYQLKIATRDKHTEKFPDRIFRWNHSGETK